MCGFTIARLVGVGVVGVVGQNATEKHTHTHALAVKQVAQLFATTDVIANSANQPTKKHQNRDRIANSGYAYANATTHSGGVLFTWVCICALGIHK